jgi:hypothetical protein
MKKFTIEVDESGLFMTRTNDGFNAFELIGILKFSLNSIQDQLSNKEDTPITTVKKVVRYTDNAIKDSSV